MINEPHMNVLKAFPWPKNISMRSGISPAKITQGTMTIADSKLLYHARSIALPFTTSKLLLMTTACKAVVHDERVPKRMPSGVVLDKPEDDAERSKTTPMRKPNVTVATPRRMRSEGRECSINEERMTVKGRTRPRATW